MISFLETIEDTRRAASCQHNFIDILVIAVCAIIANADTWEDMQEFGEEKEDWLRTFLELPHGIPAHDTFYRIFCLLDPDKFQDCFTRWVKSAFPEAVDTPDEENDIVPIDGKAIKGSRGKGKQAVHIVSAWSSRLSLVLGQKSVDKKSNEITAVPDLLAAIDLAGCLITADAMSCQKVIAETCIAEGADYLLAVKGNQKNLKDDIQNHIEQHWKNYPGDVPSETFHEEFSRGHGREEYRCCWTFSALDVLRDHEVWSGLKQFGIVQADRTINGKVTTSLRFYICSKEMTAKDMLSATRMHWEVENNLHWMLDIAFSEDACQTKNDNAAENLSTLRRIALNILKSDTTSKRSIKGKRKKAGWSNGYMAKLLKSFIVTGA
ncbi:ISAs1 family transposase [Endozoicomonas montiporae]|uniref:ISAs1 family transposase n=1 Tax=Endozoicomonas montiporae TaxID=1027273 RepID=UPI000A9E0E94|nr:ISAs1 family transposase [Endozoicomonas montiporae]